MNTAYTTNQSMQGLNPSMPYGGGLQAAQPIEPGLCNKLAEALKYVDELEAVLSQMEGKLKPRPNDANAPIGTDPGAIGAASTLCQRLANLAGYAKTINGWL